MAIIRRLLKEALVDDLEAVPKVFRHSVLELFTLCVFEEVFVLFQTLLKQLRKFYFDFTGDFVAINSVAIAHGEQVEALLTAHVGC